ncbi:MULTISPECIES: LysR family transcriptional regulator [Photobacterium]|uniref:LysR family transcriptional regulator n=1 Tax=Photobacterium ganghwense TaxID=320778 RepID=A0A0J1HFB7_9GAMM|nr:MULTISPECIES: LysR family transcriptional regulator [Photobacterium]KLV10306.1 LysR family transcriptional regulator [Photobacterium ganghwense]MBV1841986.1 LysR family transcriptional regulator [Photobacterium ganghwense]PSU09806.1 LysR family transcriptional regulator [Photobacterium ganghwense]QSV17052.1 LysR family transcriptional regulator [Photobacterium ganghwense]
MKLDDLALFLRVVKAGSFAAAARQINIPTSTLSRRIQQLESDSGRKLLVRHAKDMQLTKDGLLFVKEFAALFDDLQARVAEIDDEKDQLSGLIVINAPIIPTQHPLGLIALEFAKHHPNIQLRFQLGNQADYFMRGDIDIALRFGRQPPSDWVSRKIAHNPAILCASMEYLTTHPAISHPNELARHLLLTSNPDQRWHFLHPNGNSVSLKHNGRIQSDELDCIHHAAISGFGVAKLPEWYVRASLENGELIQVLPEWQIEGADVMMLYPSRKHLPERTQALIDFFHENWTGLNSQ